MNLKLPIITLFIACTALAAEPDILEHAAEQPRAVEDVRQPDGSYKASKYGDHDLAEAEAFLSPTHRRPWTVPQALEWFHQANDDTSRVHILRLLAASQDPRAALVLGASLDSESPKVCVAACYGLLDYFSGASTGGGSELHMKVAREWVKSNQERLQKKAATK